MKKGMLCIKLKDDDFVQIGENIFVQVARYKKTQISVKILAPKELKVIRHHQERKVVK